MQEAILIVDESPTNRKLTQTVLTGAGYTVRSVESGPKALGTLAEFQPRLILTDLWMAEMDGLALARRVKENPLTRQTLVIALTGHDAAEDRRAAIDAGFDDFIVKPFDTRTLPLTIDAHLARQRQDAIEMGAVECPPPDLPSWALELCHAFLRDGLKKSSELAAEQAADPHELRQAARLWTGLGRAFRYPRITHLARRIEEGLEAAAGKADDWRPLLRQMSDRFAEASTLTMGADSEEPPAALVDALTGKRFAITGFDEYEEARISHALDLIQVDQCDMSSCDLVIAAANRFEHPPSDTKPVLLVGDHRAGPQLPMLLDSPVMDFVTAPWTTNEVLARACRLLKRPPQHKSPPPPDRDRKLRVVVADDDPTILTLLKTTLTNYGIECQAASEGDAALELIRTSAPDVAMLDVIMPNLDGLEVLAAIRNDRGLRDVRVLMLSALQHETDIVRAFGLGADDYVAKPFSPVELVARLKRLARAAT